MYKVYLIRDIHKQNYVGITKQTIKRRLQEHECDKRNGKYCSSSKLDFTCCKISILEDDITENKREREQYWIDKIDCVNEHNAYHNKKEYDKEYYEEHKEEIKKYKKKYDKEHYEDKKKYREEHKEERKEYHKQYRDYKKSWGGDNRSNNNLLLIDTTLFLN